MKTVKPSQLGLDQPQLSGVTHSETPPSGTTDREQLIQATMPHIDPHSAAYQGDMGKVDAIALEARAREALELDDEFNWNTDDSIILKEQRATAVYFNRLGELIIRQKAAWSDDEDSIVYVMPENFNGLLDGIAARIRQGGGTQ